jgi:hypothetical protein
MMAPVRHEVLVASACSFTCAMLVVSGCFSPDFGQGRVRCGDDQSCPPHYQCWRGACVTDGSDLSTDAPSDFGAPGDLVSCAPSKSCNSFCGTLADDGCGHPLRCDCIVPNTCSLQTANSCACTPIKSCSQLHDIHCGRYPDGCGGFVTCPNCPGMQVCGAGPQPYSCGNQAQCKGRACLPGQCGIIANDCNDIVICPDCPLPQVCGGAGRANWCG